MPSQKAITLLLRVVLPDGRRRYLNPHKVHGKVKPQWAVNTKPTHFPDGIYALRYYLNKRVIFQSVGPDLDVALVEQRKIANRVEGILLGTVAAPPAPEPGVQDNRLTLREAVNKYLHEVDRNKSHETYRSYNNALEQFIASCSKTHLDDLTRDDGQAFIQAMQNNGLTNHSICLKLQILNTFLKNMESPQILKPKEWPRYTDKAAVSYSRDELTALLSAANPEEQMLYRFFLGSGFRLAEVAVAQYQDVDFGRGTVLVREKKELGFMPKSRKVRLVPLPDDLLRDLQERWLRRPSDKLIFPTGVPGKFCTREHETNWYERSWGWHEERSTQRSRS